MRAYMDFFKNYFNWYGRTGRKGFWIFIMVNIVAITFFQMLDRLIAVNLLGFTVIEVNHLTGIYPVTFFYMIVTLLPGISLFIRRLHDIDKSGWWLLIVLIPLLGALLIFIFTCIKSDGDNRFGNCAHDGYTS